ncbi:MAG TPA: FkbM family methyltransferase, partial [Candidatus Babeliales bacterium]|nr:FkbM family methyltransferase [Candidatus Babeliales bacterium]
FCIDFMWLDMEGYELFALQKGINILQTTKVLFIEVQEKEIRKGSCLQTNIMKFLEKEGFCPIWQSKINSLYQSNILFVRKELL